MSQKYKDKYDELREKNFSNTNTKTSELSPLKHTYYDTPGNIRYITFTWPDGTSQSLNYSYLVSLEFNLDGDRNTILLKFTSHTITLRGYKLKELFYKIEKQFASEIIIQDDRYMLCEENEPVVTELECNEN